MDYKNMMEDSIIELRRKLTFIMVEKDFTFKELAEDMKMTSSTIFYFLRAKIEPRFKTLYKIDAYIKRVTSKE